MSDQLDTQRIHNGKGAYPPTKSNNTGCLDALVLTAVYLVVVAASFIRHTVTLMSTFEINDTPRQAALIGAGVHFILLTILLLPLALFWSGPRRKIFQGWLIANSLILFSAPNYLFDYDAFQIHACVLIALFVLFIAGLILAIRKRTRSNSGDEKLQSDAGQLEAYSSRFLGSSLIPLSITIIALFVWLPWLALGAFGSPLDTILAILLACCVATAVALMIRLFVLERADGSTKFSWSDFYVSGLAISGFITILVSALSFSFGGLQLLLLRIAPGLGWLVVLFSLSNRIESPEGDTSLDTRTVLRALSLPVFLIGATLAAPLAMVDPDELLLVLSASPGEILPTASRAALQTTLLITAFIIISLVVFSRSNSSKTRGSRESRNSRGLAIILVIANLAVLGAAVWTFVSSGQPGFHGERLFVILKPQVDFATLRFDKSGLDRREVVYQAMVKLADESQINLRRALDKIGIGYTPYYLVNAIEVDGGPAIKLWLENFPEVERILASPQLRPLPKNLPIQGGYPREPEGMLWNQTLIHADRVWEEMNVFGAGIVIGQSDSGVQGDHPELADSYRGAPGQHDYNWFDPWNNSLSPVDIGGHGTHTLGTILGNRTGIAPEAEWIGCVNLARNLGNPAFYLDCMQFMLAPFPLDGDPFRDGNPQLGVNIMNNSWGCPEIEGCDANVFLTAVRALQAAGIFFVASAGNEGPECSSLKDPPPIYEEAFAVGAIDRKGELASFSNIGPVVSDNSKRIKPDLVAPGVSILSALPNSTYGEFSGTSMAGPHVAGVVALMWSANPSLIGQIDLTRDILIRSAQPYQGRIPQCPGAEEFPSTAVGYGILDAYQAVKLAMEAKLP